MLQRLRENNEQRVDPKSLTTKYLTESAELQPRFRKLGLEYGQFLVHFIASLEKHPTFMTREIRKDLQLLQVRHGKQTHTHARARAHTHTQ